MKFIILGSSPGMPNLNTHQSCIYVSVNGKHLLFDCGEGTSHQLLKHGLDGDVLDAIFISHYHPDHISGIFMVLQMLYLQQRKKALQLFLPERPAALLDAMQMFYTFAQKFSFPLQIHDCTEIELHHDDISSAMTDHLLGYEEIVNANSLPNQMRSYAFRIEDYHGTLVYTSDIATTDSIASFIEGAHSVIVDALHPSSDQILKLQYQNIKRVLLSHGQSDELLNWLRDNPLSMFESAQEDKEYYID
ncbi:MAG: ribonuclease Z [Candidatus Cloacimonadaceae bacterium]|nr:ribonuclease Z [Candidatus Cloacimonadaceae bacterium]